MPCHEARANLIGEVIRERCEEMNALWVQANSDTTRKPFTPSPRRDNIPKPQHYIPRFWLAGFADEAGKVSAVDLAGEKRTRQTSPKRAATEDHFYTLTDDDGERTPVLEDLLGRIESDASPAFKRVAAGRCSRRRRTPAALFCLSVLLSCTQVAVAESMVLEVWEPLTGCWFL